MKCQICHTNEANIVFTQIVDNEKIVMQICTECAQKKGLSIEFHSADSMHHEISSFNAGGESSHISSDETISAVQCANCGLTFGEFKKSGLFGCDKCHESFGDLLDPIIMQLHGVKSHTSVRLEQSEKSPRPVSQKKILKQLNEELRNCVLKEEYERAAELRDRIAELQKEGRNGDDL